MHFESEFELMYFRLFLDVVAHWASAGTPIHRAKALKLARPNRESGLKILTRMETESFWKELVKSGFIQTNTMGHIIGLSTGGQKFLQ